MSAKSQIKLVRIVLEMAEEAGLRVWSITTDGTTVNISIFREHGCNFTTSMLLLMNGNEIQTVRYHGYAILDPCHMLKLARNALAHVNILWR